MGCQALLKMLLRIMKVRTFWTMNRKHCLALNKKVVETRWIHWLRITQLQLKGTISHLRSNMKNNWEHSKIIKYKKSSLSLVNNREAHLLSQHWKQVVLCILMIISIMVKLQLHWRIEFKNNMICLCKWTMR